MQSRKRSVKEAAVNILIGFSINYTANVALLPVLWDGRDPFLGAFLIGLAFTIISAIRQYVIRRWFNKGDSHAPSR
jgi:hypothetical protein